jgi:putative transposase
VRVARKIVPGVVYHIIARLVDRKWFIKNMEERTRYLALLANAMSKSDWRCLAYAIMSNHIHLAMVAGWSPLASWTISVHAPFAGWMNERYKRIGPLFTRGPKALAILPENVGKLLAYIHNNPVRAGVAKYASDSNWTSHRAYVRIDAAPAWLDVAEGLRRAGFDDPDEFDAWINDTPGESGNVDLRRVRKEARRRGAIEVATPLVGKSSQVPLVGRPGAHVRIEPRRIVQITAGVLNLTELELCSSRRDRRIAAARAVAVHAANRAGLSDAQIAACMGISPQAAWSVRNRGVPAALQEVLAIVLCHVFDEALARRAS